MSKVTVRIIELDRKPMPHAYFRLPDQFVGELIREDVDNIVVNYGGGNYCFKQSEVTYMVHDNK